MYHQTSIIYSMYQPVTYELTQLLIFDVFNNSVEMEDASGVEFKGKPYPLTFPLILDESKTAKSLSFPMTLLQTQPKCEVYPDLHKIIQVLSAGKK